MKAGGKLMFAPVPMVVAGVVVAVVATGAAVVLTRGGADVEKLHQAPDDFKAFIRSAYKKLTAGMSSAVIAQCHPVIDVYALRTDGFAIGGESGCGGAAELWAKVDGSWKTVLGMQDFPSCRDLRRLHFPPDVFDKGVLAQCVENDGRNVKYAA